VSSPEADAKWANRIARVAKLPRHQASAFTPLLIAKLSLLLIFYWNKPFNTSISLEIVSHDLPLK
jgi:hypothetical protein